MVINVVNIQDIPIKDAKNHTPVRANGHGSQAFEFAFKRMQPKPWQVHVRNFASGVKADQNVA
jgi:hypothetical protein